MRNALFTLFATFVFFTLTAQKPEVKISDKIKLNSGEILEKYLLSTDDGYFVKAVKPKGSFFYGSNQSMLLQKYSKDFDKQFSSQFELSKDDVYTTDIFNFQQKLVLVTKEINKKEDYINYSFVPIDYKAKAGKPVKFGTFKFEKKKDDPDVYFTWSEDSTYLAFVAMVDNDDNDDILSVYIAVTNNNLEPQWSKKISLKKPQEVIQFISAAVNNEGKVYLLYKEYEGKKAKESKDDRPAYTLKIALVDGNVQNSDYKNIKLELNNDFLVSADVKVMPNGDIGVIGMYSATKKKYTNGVFTLKIDNATDSVFNISKKAFSNKDLEYLNEEDNTSNHRGEEGLSSEFGLIDVTFLKDGSAYITMEENYSYTQSIRTGAVWTTVTYYVSKDIIVIQLDGNGDILGINTIPKRQRFADSDQYNSSIVLVNDNGYHAIYNEDVDNLGKPIGEKKKYISSLGDCVAVMTSIDKDGYMKRIPLFDKQDTKAVLMPKYSAKINNKEVFFIASKRGFFSGTDRRIGTISL